MEVKFGIKLSADAGAFITSVGRGALHRFGLRNRLGDFTAGGDKYVVARVDQVAAHRRTHDA